VNSRHDFAVSRSDTLHVGRVVALRLDPVTTARRELMEEAGCTARDWSVLVDVVPSPGFSDEAVRVFLARGLTEVGRPAGGDDEEADLSVVRMPLAEAVRQVMAGEIVNASAVAGLLAVQAVLAGTAQPRPLHASWPHRPIRFADRRNKE
jgi:8-oxo-dGDP phosphatase